MAKPPRIRAMQGRVKKLQSAAKLAQTAAIPAAVAAWPVCPLCQRPVPPDQQDAHHLVPKSQGGRETVVLHRICHRQLHALFSETELARHYASAEALLAHPDIARFVAWVQRRPPDFFERTRKSVQLRARRRG
jgi:hypothetical protein